MEPSDSSQPDGTGPTVQFEDGWFIAYEPECTGANGQGRTREAALESLAESIRLIHDDALESRYPLRGTIRRYDRPTDPVVDPDDWEVSHAMNPRVIKVTPGPAYTLRLEFTNGEVGAYDCSPLLDFGVFTELRDVTYFNRAFVLDGTVAWPHDQDIDPDTLYLDSNRGGTNEA